jgi:hypothetical protein
MTLDEPTDRQRLAERQQTLSGRQLIGRGMYEQAAERLPTHLERLMATALLQARTFDTLGRAASPTWRTAD